MQRFLPVFRAIETTGFSVGRQRQQSSAEVNKAGSGRVFIWRQLGHCSAVVVFGLRSHLNRRSKSFGSPATRCSSLRYAVRTWSSTGSSPRRPPSRRGRPRDWHVPGRPTGIRCRPRRRPNRPSTAREPCCCLTGRPPTRRPTASTRGAAGQGRT